MGMYFSNLARKFVLGGESLKAFSLVGLIHSQQRMGKSVNGQGDAIGDSGLAHQLRNMGLDRSFLDPQGEANLAIGPAGNQQVEYLAFAPGEYQRIFRSHAAGDI